MAKFNVGRSVTTAVPEVVVDAGMPAGRHRFRLVVLDRAGNTSRPDEIVLTINRLGLPISLGGGTGGTTLPPLLQPITPVTPVTPVLPVMPVMPVVPVVPVVPLVPSVPVVPVRPPRPPVTQALIPPRRPRGRNRSKP